MRIRSTHIIVGCIAAVSVFVIFAVSRTRAEDNRLDVAGDDFYQGGAVSTVSRGSEDGNLPGMDEAPDKFPRIEIESEKVVLEGLSNTEKSVREFKVTNAGESPLVIRQVQTTCPCTMGYFSESREPTNGPLATIPPGKSRPMYIEIDPFKIMGWEATKHLTIWSNDPQKANVVVEVNSHIDPEFEYTALHHDFGKVGRGQNHTATFLLRQITDEPFDVKGARATLNAVMPSTPGLTPATGGELIPTFDLRVIKRAEAQWQTPGKAEWAIEISLSPSLPEGPFNGYYEIETTSKRLAKFQCSFEAQIESFFRVVPEVITSRGLRQGDTKVGSARVIAEVPFTVNDLRVEGPYFSAKAVPEEQGHAVNINVDVEPTAPLGPKSAVVLMNVTAEDGQTFEHKIGIAVNIRPAETPAN